MLSDSTFVPPILNYTGKTDPVRMSVSNEQKDLIERVHSQVPALVDELEGLDSAEVASLTTWADAGTVRRFLNATNYKEEAALVRLKATLVWRSQYKPDRISPGEIEVESTTGKLFINGFDKQGRPLLFGIPRLDSNKTYDRYLRFCVFMMEKTIAIMPDGQEKLCLMMDNDGLGLFNGPPVSFLTNFVRIMDSHYPGRLGMCMLINPTFIVSGIYRIISPFLDPVVKSKVYFTNAQRPEAIKTLATIAPAEKTEKSGGGGGGGEFKELGGWTSMLEHIDSDQLMVQYGGTNEFQYKHDEYWPRLLSVNQHKV
ncbi:CRAL-TRIO domain-containing protein [Obelidium mucronatum]|nr:CRAL-TRIO domain-containing protein [Obelidium mucronatum]